MQNIVARKTPMRIPGFLFPLLVALVVPAFAADAPPETAARTFVECAGCPEMVAIPAGKFLMGSPKSEPGRFDLRGTSACGPGEGVCTGQDRHYQ